jgi:hypothetical protein
LLKVLKEAMKLRFDERRSDLKTIRKMMWKKVRGPVNSMVLAVLLLTVTALPTTAAAASLTGNSNTYFQSREGTDKSDLMPIYEYLDFTVQDLGMESVSVHFGGWLGYDLNDSSFGDGKKKGSDLQYGYVSYRSKEGNALVNLGRIMVFEGVAAERLDGISARTDLRGGFGISAFGGSPVEVGTDLAGNNIIYGARVSHQSTGIYTIGLSYLKEDKNSNTFREEEGVDLWLRPVNKVELMGRSSYNAETKGWMEHTYYLMLGPFDKLRFNTEASWINYGDYFAGATTNVFSIAPGGPIDPREKVNILGEEVFFAINSNWAISADYKNYGYDIAGSANYYGVKATYVKAKSYNAGVAVHRMDGDTDPHQYDEYRIYASKKIDKFDVTVDLLDVKYKVAINDVTNAYSATLAAGYELTEKLKLGADVEYGKNPDFDKDVRLFLKLNYRFDAEPGKRKGV